MEVRRKVADASRDATFAFLFRLGISGVGVSHAQGDSRVVFFLGQDSDATRTVLDRWAAEQGVPIEIKVAGDKSPLR